MFRMVFDHKAWALLHRSLTMFIRWKTDGLSCRAVLVDSMRTLSGPKREKATLAQRVPPIIPEQEPV